MLFESCITPANIDPSDPDSILVVDGFITDAPGPHEFRVERVSPFAGVRQGGVTQLEEGAQVRIVDDLGRVTELQRNSEIVKSIFNAVPEGCVPVVSFREALTPSYKTPEEFSGVVGRTYTLEIVTAGGETFRSEPQLMIETPAIDSLILQFKELPSVSSIPGSGVEVFSTFQDSPGEDYYFWKVNGIYRINTMDRPGACCLFDPSDGREENCWIVETDIMGNEFALSDRFFDEQLTSQPIGLIEDDGLRFASDFVAVDQQYYVEVEQYRISRDAFLFNERIAVLQDINGEIFDPPPLSIRGNVFNVEDPDQPVIGFFGAYSVSVRSVFVNGNMLDFRQPFPNPCGDCRVRKGAQVRTPEPYL